MRRFRELLGYAALAGGLACGGSTTPSNRALPESGAAWLRVDNQTFVDLNMSVWHNNARQRLGRSTANTSTTFRIPSSYVGTRSRLRFIADPIGRAQESLTRELDVIPGDTVIMIIPPN
jgi:hypothetical protein